ncbi:unnamed protein product [Effrenium voratum]|uniref:Uncharacterized protein n=1 Tax=Effrenium voratum TaxID=2562239 RepID=A0AA36HXT7_9DINO|nr:unnamed protein product [Effrenium voratum]
MTLLKALDKIRAAAGQTNRRLHLQYLQAYAENQVTPPLGEVVVFLENLRKVRSVIASQGSQRSQRELKRFFSDCENHAGFARLRGQLQSEDLTVSGNLLARLYGSLRRMDFHSDAERVWPCVMEQAKQGKLESPDLFRVWATCPPDKLPALDSAVSKAMLDTKSVKAWQMLIVLSRSGAAPSESETLRVCVERLGQMLQDVQVSPSDIVKIYLRMHLAAPKQGAIIGPELLKDVKQQLVSRGATLQPAEICSLLPALETSDVPLWHMLRDQLLAAKDLSLRQCLDVLEFLQRIPNSSGEQNLKSRVVRRLEFALSRGFSDPNEVADVSRRLEVVASFGKVCNALARTAISLRQDLYPGVLWRFFNRAGEVGLADQHTSLLAKFDKIGEILESHGVQADRMSMPEMVKAVKAMRANKVTMPNCVDQIVQHFLKTLQHGESHLGDSAGTAKDEDSAATSGEADADAEKAAAAESVKSREDASAVPQAHAPLNLLAKVQHMVLLLWAELERMEQPNPELTAAVLEICSPERCKLSTRMTGECLAEFADLEAAGSLRAPLLAALGTRLPELSSSELLSLVTGSVQAAALAMEEVDKRLLADTLRVSSGSDIDQLLACLSNLRQRPGDETAEKLARKVCQLLLNMPETHLTQIMQAVCSTLSELCLEEPSLRPKLCKGLRQLATAKSPSPAAEVELLFAIAKIYGGNLPLDMMAYSWQLATRSSQADLKDAEKAKLWAFALAARKLSSSATWASLRLAPGAPSLDPSVFPPKEPKLPSFVLQRDQASQALVGQIRLALPSAVPSQLSEPLFQVPGTPYVADFAFEQLAVFLVVPRAAHQAGERQLNGFGRLMQATLEALGWRILWAWPSDWAGLLRDASDEEAVAALKSAIVEGKVESQKVAADEEQATKLEEEEQAAKLEEPVDPDPALKEGEEREAVSGAS